MADDLNVMKLKGKLMYAKLFQPDTRFDPKWTADVLLDAQGLEEAQKANLRVKKNDKWGDLFDGYDGSYVRVERPTTNFAGEERDPPVVKDAKVRDVPSSTGVGNGTDAYVRFLVKTQDNRGNQMSPAEAHKKYGGYGMFLTGVQIVNLVPYERSSDPDTDFVEEDGDFDIGGNGGFEAVGDAPFDDELPI